MKQRNLDIIAIKKIIKNKDEVAVIDKACSFIYEYRWDEEVLLLLCQLFEADWHTWHENMALGFQGIRNPVAAKSLYNVALSEFEYCAWDDGYPLQRKCTWALADIGTDEAKSFLEQIEQKANKVVSSYASKRLRNWDDEYRRKGQILKSTNKFGFNLPLEKYSDSLSNLPKQGQRVIGNVLEKVRYIDKWYKSGDPEKIIDEYIVVYQAYKPSIAEYAVEHQKLGGPDFSLSRMSWIKPNFLWMMYRCGWAEKEHQERVLAIWIKKKAFEEILQKATFTSFFSAFFASESAWRKELETKNVRLQWDPDHNCIGEKLERRAIQLGLKGSALKKFAQKQIECILDITDFVKEQKKHIDNKQIDKLLIPKERVIIFDNEKLMQKIGNEKPPVV